MNLQQLSSPLPKPWLDIACDVLACRSLAVQNPAVFSSTQSGSAFINGATYTNLCNVADIATPAYDPITNRYTAPTAQTVEFSVYFALLWPVAITDSAASLLIQKNGVDTLYTCGLKANQGTQSIGSMRASGIFQLVAGDVLGYRILTAVASGPGGVAITTGTIIGRVCS